MKVSIIEQDNNVQEEADNHKVNETGKNKQTGRSTRHELLFVQKESTDNAAPNGKTSLEKDARKFKKSMTSFILVKYEQLITVRL